MVRTSGKTIEALAGDLGVSDQTLRNWMRQADADAGRGRKGDLTSAEKAELHVLKRENRVLREEREILNKSRGLVREGERNALKCYRFIETEKARQPVAMLCRVFEVSQTGFYSGAHRDPSHRAQEDAALLGSITEIHRDCWSRA